ncbi:MAG: hypothetical protein RMX67_10540, partial [Planktomarina sp.]|nr:hypothetical protein [Planktomarina sp.]
INIIGSVGVAHMASVEIYPKWLAKVFTSGASSDYLLSHIWSTSWHTSGYIVVNSRIDGQL